jgi:hypothetical protein
VHLKKLAFALALGGLLLAGILWLRWQGDVPLRAAHSDAAGAQSESSVVTARDDVGIERRVTEAPDVTVALDDEQRRFDEIRELVRANRIGDARTAAYEYLTTYPEGRLRRDIENYTGVRLRPSAPGAR